MKPHIRSALVTAALLAAGPARAQAPEPGWFAFTPPDDSFAGDALLDLRPLNHGRAGEKGWLQVRDGTFRFEQDDAPYAFWAVGTTYWSREPWGADHARVDYQARRFAKLGINLVRLWPARGTQKFDAAHLDAFRYQVAAYAKQGIYSQCGFFWDVEAKFPHAVDGYEAGRRIPSTVLFFDDAVQEVYFDWAREIFTAPNCDRRSIAATWLASRP